MRLVLILAFVLSQGPPAQAQQAQPAAKQQPAPDQRGTAQEPAIVKIVPPDSSKAQTAQAAKERADHAENERRVTIATVLLAVYTLLLAAGTAVLATATYNLWSATKEMAADTSRSAASQLDIMRDQLDAMTGQESRLAETVEQMRASEERQLRAYFDLKGWIAMGVRNMDGSVRAWDIQAEFENFGQTPARHVLMGCDSRHLPAGEVPKWDPIERGDNILSGHFAPHTGGRTNPIRISIEDVEALRKGDRAFYLSAFAIYRDVFAEAPERTTVICVQLIVQYNPRTAENPFRFSNFGDYDVAT